MRIPQFAMERMQSTWENLVDYNLSESGVHPMRLEELVEDPADRAGLLGQELVYPQSNGTIELRERVAAMYPGATADHVEVTNGGSEANFVTMWHLVEPGDEVVSMVPNYGQTLGLAEAFGGVLKPWPLRLSADGKRWHVDLDDLRRLVTAKTRLIILCNPNNPTGRASRHPTSTASARLRPRVGAWVLSDEIYRGAELDGVETPSVWGRYERVIITSGLSKAYGLPGLRIGWIVSSPQVVATTWGYHDYTTIGPGTLSDRLARIALQPAMRAKILARTRRILHDEPAGHHRLARRPRRALQLRPARRRRHRLHAVPRRDQLHRARRPAARREERADRAGRSFRDGRLPAHRLRQRNPVPARRARQAATTCSAACRAGARARVARGLPGPAPRRVRQRRPAVRAPARGEVRAPARATTT